MSKQITAIIVGAGHRAILYSLYALEHPDELKIVGVADPDPIRRKKVAEMHGFGEEMCFRNAEELAARPKLADAVINGTMDRQHVPTAVPLLRAGYDMLLEKPFAISEEEVNYLYKVVKETGRKVMICHVLRYAPFYVAIKQRLLSGEIGDIINIQATEHVSYHHLAVSFVRGKWGNEEKCGAPMLLAKCCHDIDFLLWLTGAHCRSLSSFGSLRWFRAANAPQTSTERCIDCPVEHDCPYSAVDLYCTRRDWISNFDVPQGRTLDEVLLEELRHGPYGRCIYRCDNDVVDHQLLTMELADETILSLSMDIFTQDDCRRTHIKMTHGEIFGDERKLHVHRFRRGHNRVYDFEELAGHPFHAGADLRLIEDFVDALTRPGHPFLCTIEDSIESHRICFEAERSRRCGETIRLE